MLGVPASLLPYKLTNAAVSEQASISFSLVSQAVLTPSRYVVIAVGIAVDFSAYLTPYQSYSAKRLPAVSFSCAFNPDLTPSSAFADPSLL